MLKKSNGWHFLAFAMYAFAGLGLEVLLAFLIEPLIYGCEMSKWSTGQYICHWVITCVLWISMSFLLIKLMKNRYGFDIFEKQDKIKWWKYLIVVGFLALMIIYSYIDWNGSKVLKEFYYNGWLKFIFQYIYYACEVVLVLLIIIFGQKAFEKWFHKDNKVLIPYGGILTGLTWGLVHILTKGSFITGLALMIVSIGYGLTYLLLNRDVKQSYLWILLMFII